MSQLLIQGGGAAVSPGDPAALTATYVGFGSGLNVVTGEAAFAYSAPTNTLFVDNLRLAIGGDATGDVYYRSSGGPIARLGVGTNGHVLTLAAGLPTWAAAGGSSTTLTATQIAYGSVGNAVTSEAAFTYNDATDTLTVGTVAAATAITVGGVEVGYKNVPQNSQSAAYTLVLADGGKHIYHPATDANARTFTIPANASVAYPIGTSITFINDAAAVVTIAINTDTLALAGTGTTGSRSLALYGIATAVKVTSTRWIINGTGLT